MRTLLKAITVSSTAVVAFLLLPASVAEPTASASVKHTTMGIEEVSEQVPHAVRRTVRSSTKAKRSAPTPTLAQVTLAPEEGLLPVVQHDNILPRHQELANTVLRALPHQCRTYLKNFYVQYTNVQQRGLGGKSTIIIDGTVPDEEFVGLLVHECGHVTHGNMRGTQSSGVSTFRDGQDIFYADSPIAQFFALSWSAENILKKGSSKHDFVSGYAQSDAFEDFAETFAMYILHRQSLRDRAESNAIIAAKLAWMETTLPIPEQSISTSLYTWDKKVPWDSTRLPHTLLVAR